MPYVSGEQIKRWLRTSVPLRMRLAEGTLGLSNGMDNKVRLAYKLQTVNQFTLGGETYRMGPSDKFSLIVADWAFNVFELHGQDPETEVFVHGHPVGWELYMLEVNGVMTYQMTFPSALAAVTYVDLITGDHD
jgi:hypothetical protein